MMLWQLVFTGLMVQVNQRIISLRWGLAATYLKEVLFLCSPKGEAYSYSRCFVCLSIRYLVRQITLTLLLAFKLNLVYR